MPQNFLIRHSVSEIETCVANALGELLGERVEVKIDGLQLTDVINGRAEFTVSASYGAQEGRMQ